MPVLRLQDAVSYTSSLYSFSDDSSDNFFYSTQPEDTLLTARDSLRFKHFSNAFGLSIFR